MAHIEDQLISRITKTGCMGEVLKWGITTEDFVTAPGKAFFQEFHAQWIEKKSVLGPNAIKHIFPNFELCDDEHTSTNHLCEEVRKNRLVLDATRTGTRLVELAAVDPFRAMQECQLSVSQLIKIGSRKNTDMSAVEGACEVDSRIKKAKAGMLGKFPFPWAPLQAVTGGYSEEEYMLLYGRPKSKKSFVLADMAAHAYLENQLCVGAFTKEMTSVNLYQRIYASCLKIDYSRFRLGNLTQEEEFNWECLKDYIEQRRTETNGRHNIVMLNGKDMPPGGDNMSWIQSKIEEYGFDIIFIDGLYLMSAQGVRANANTYDKITAISRAARQVPISTGCPMVATLQATRSAAKHNDANLDEIAFSDALAQDATCAIRVMSDKEKRQYEVTNPYTGEIMLGPEIETISLAIAGSREYKLKGLRIGGVPSSDFKFKELLEDKDIENAKRKDIDDNDDNAQQKKGHRKSTKQQKDEVTDMVDRAVGAYTKTFR